MTFKQGTNLEEMARNKEKLKYKTIRWHMRGRRLELNCPKTRKIGIFIVIVVVFNVKYLKEQNTMYNFQADKGENGNKDNLVHLIKVGKEE